MTRRVNHEFLPREPKSYYVTFQQVLSGLYIGTIVNSRGPVSYIVKLTNVRHIKHHVDHLRKTEVPTSDHDTEAEVLDDCFPVPVPTQTTPTQVETAQYRSNHIASFD